MLERKNQAIMAIQNISAISEETAASAEQVSASAIDQQAELQKVAESIDNMEKTYKRLLIDLSLLNTRMTTNQICKYER
ncbi:hypothetical protein ACIQXF_16755 [Lysinibacillus sp. NPDC097231]|uniref:hypothetical protein n=1 Tax=Lysinibacillus sp. NPDC097231 TaxID=3364142 RepID=UPI00382FE427